MTKLGIGVSPTLQSSNGSLISGPTIFTMTVTTTGAQTLTLQDVGTTLNGSLTVDWGDGTNNVYTGAGPRTHVYSGAGIWTVTISNIQYLDRLSLNDTKITSIIINPTNKLPNTLRYLSLSGLPGLSWTVSSVTPMPSNLTTLYLMSLPGLTWTINSETPVPNSVQIFQLQTLINVNWIVTPSSQVPASVIQLYFVNMFSSIVWTINTSTPMPPGLATLYLVNAQAVNWNIFDSTQLPSGIITLFLQNSPNIIWNTAVVPLPTSVRTLTLISLTGLSPISSLAVDGIRSFTYENNLTQSQLTTLLLSIYSRRFSFTWTSLTLDIAGTGNASPSGVYADEDPPTTGKGYIYELMNDPEGEGFKKWTITYTP